jgi:predicted PurR-regulated permease PerM
MQTEWSTFTRAVVVSIGILICSWLLYLIWPIIDPLIIAALLAYVLNPLVRLLQRRARLARKWAAAIVYFSGLVLMITIPGALTPLAITQVRGLVGRLTHIEAQIEATLAEPLVFAGQSLHLGQLLSDFLKMTSTSLASLNERTLTVLETTSMGLVWLLVILVSLYYFLSDGDKLIDWLVRLAPATIHADLRRLLREIDVVWQAYLRGTLVLMIIVGLVFTILWLAIGVPGAAALGPLAGVLTVIPDIGPTAVAVLAVLIAFFQGSNVLPLSNFWFAVLVLGIYFVLIQFKSIWLRPRIMKSFLHLNEGLIFVSIVAATIFWGILGALVIVPLLATLAVLGRYVRCRLLHLPPWPEQTANNSPADTVSK